MENFGTIIIRGEIRKEFISASGEVRACFGYGAKWGIVKNKWFLWLEVTVILINMPITIFFVFLTIVGVKILSVDRFFDGGEIKNFLDMEILNFTWLPWQPDTVTGSGCPPVFKTRPIMFWSMHNQPYVGRIAFCRRKKMLKSGETRAFYSKCPSSYLYVCHHKSI